jgi:hypothetical protein
MYVARGHEVFYCHPNETGSEELFLTVHETRDCTKLVEEQARSIARMLNVLPPVRGLH